MPTSAHPSSSLILPAPSPPSGHATGFVRVGGDWGRAVRSVLMGTWTTLLSWRASPWLPTCWRLTHGRSSRTFSALPQYDYYLFKSQNTWLNDTYSSLRICSTPKERPPPGDRNTHKLNVLVMRCSGITGGERWGQGTEESLGRFEIDES